MNNINLQQVNALLDTLHFNSFAKLYGHVKRQFNNITKKQLRRIIIQRKHDVQPKHLRKYRVHIYSPSRNTWFMDIFDNGRGSRPPYYHVFISTNTRYAVVQPLNSRDAEDIRQSLLDFILQYHPVKITSDNERSFLERQNLQLLEDMRVIYQTVPDKNHSTLALIDRFIRTIRDMKADNRPIDVNTMNTLVNEYNNTYHQAIECKPIDMYNNKALEKEYILKMQAKRDKQRQLNDFIIPIGAYVRYMIDKDPLTKRRYRFTTDSYKVIGHEGNHYLLQASNGKVITKPRFKLIIADQSKHHQANDISNGRLYVTEITNYDPRTQRYAVKLSNNTRGHVTKLQLRHRYPLRLTKQEHQYWYRTA